LFSGSTKQSKDIQSDSREKRMSTDLKESICVKTFLSESAFQVNLAKVCVFEKYFLT